eukprot:307054-Rhodomonas_salina.2
MHSFDPMRATTERPIAASSVGMPGKGFTILSPPLRCAAKVGARAWSDSDADVARKPRRPQTVPLVRPESPWLVAGQREGEKASGPVPALR